MATQAQLAAVQQLYIGYLGRAADQAGQNFWADAIASGAATIESVALGFTLSEEYKGIYGELTGADLVAKVYENLLDRAPDAEGQAFWVKALEDGTVTADTLVATMLGNLGAQDQQIVNNKVYVANTYTNKAGADYNVKAGAEVVTAPEGKTFDASVVTEKLADIANGNLPGEVPGLHLIAAKDKAVAAEAAYAKEVKLSSQEAVNKLAAAKEEASNKGSVEQNKLHVQQAQLDLKVATDELIATGKTPAEQAQIKQTLAAYDTAIAADKAADKAVEDNALAYGQAAGGFNALSDDKQGGYESANAAVAAINDPAKTPAKRAEEIEKVLKLEFGSEIVKQANLEKAQAEAATKLAQAENAVKALDENLVKAQQALDSAEQALAAAEAALVTAEDNAVQAKADADTNKADSAYTSAVSSFEAANAGSADYQTATAVIDAINATADEQERAAKIAEIEKEAVTDGSVTKSDFDAIVNQANLEKAAVDAEAEANAATQVVADAEDNVAIAQGNVDAADSSAHDYVVAKGGLVGAEKALTDAEKAAADVVKAQEIVDQFKALEKATADADKAIADFLKANPDVSLENLTSEIAKDVVAKDDVKDVFYFSPEKIANDEGDKTITKFGNGDAIVLGANYSQGADVAKGDNNKLEFFLVQTDKGLQVVVESAAYGSDGVKVTSVGGVNYDVTTTETAFTIDLVGVKADQVTFDNGVLSFV